MNRKGEYVPLAVLWLICGAVFFRATPHFAIVYEELYGAQTTGLPLLTRVIVSLPSVLWLAIGILAGGSILVLNQKHDSRWINLAYLLGLLAVAASGAIGLLRPLVGIIGSGGPS
jgi:hypothetical protein